MAGFDLVWLIFLFEKKNRENTGGQRKSVEKPNREKNGEEIPSGEMTSGEKT